MNQMNEYPPNNGYPQNPYYGGYNETQESVHHENTQHQLNEYQNQPPPPPPQNGGYYMPDISQYNNYTPCYYDQQMYAAYNNNQQDEGE